MTQKQWLFHGSNEEQTNTVSSIEDIDFHALIDPKFYKTNRDLAAAVNVAITLGMPLLLTGEPGSGKSQLAYRIAWEMGFKGDVLRFSVKSTTEAKDLFYTFDTVGRFHAAYTSNVDANQGKSNDADAVNFIHYQALGWALLKAKGQQHVESAIMQAEQYKQLPNQGERSVVLIDEIDKAPREVPNDILTEIENMSFTIPELGGKEIKLNTGSMGNDGQQEPVEPRPIVIITSNSERDLPEAFLRRCVFYHVPFPPFDGEECEVTVRSIVAARFAKRFGHSSPLLDDILSLAEHMRVKGKNLTKLPSLAEFLNWVDLLIKNDLDASQGLNQKDFGFLQASVVPTLMKTIDDQLKAQALLQEWWNQNSAKRG